MKRMRKENQRANGLLKLNADSDELIENLRALEQRRQKLSDSVRCIREDCERLEELLCCATKDDIEHTMEEAFPIKDIEEEKFHMSNMEKDLLISRISLLQNFEVQKIFGISLHTTDDNHILAELYPFPNYEHLEMYLVDFIKESRFKLKLNHFIMPSFEEITKLQEAYINQKSQDIPSFLYYIQQCLLNFWTRNYGLVSLKKENENENIMKLFYNRNRTFVSFILKFDEKLQVEFKLYYDSAASIPHKVQYRAINNRIIPNNLITIVDGCKNLLLSNSLRKALEDNIFVDISSNGSSHSSNSPVATTSAAREFLN